MERSLPQSAVELKAYLIGLDREILERSMEWGRQCYKAVLEQVDEGLAACRDRGLAIEHRRAAWYQTCLGPVQVRRRQYRDKLGKRSCILDEAMGMGRHKHVSRGVEELALDCASQMPYRRSAEVLRKASAIDMTHQTIWRLVARSADPWLAGGERELEWFRETGEIPQGEGRQVAQLMVEADGVMVSLQRSKERKAEVKLGIAYEGWQRVGKDRYRTVSKSIFATVGPERQFWDGFTFKLGKRYDLASIKRSIVGGDGAQWVKDGASYMGARFQLDRYHLNRELTRALGHDSETKAKVWRACVNENPETGLAILAEAESKARGETRERIAHACSYLRQNISGISDYRLESDYTAGLRRTGAIEGNVDKLVARRMKNQGMAWTVKGIQRLLCVRFLVLEGKLSERLRQAKKAKTIPPLPAKQVRRIVTNLSSHEPDDWLKARLPALYGPHASRPYVRALRQISEPSSI